MAEHTVEGHSLEPLQSFRDNFFIGLLSDNTIKDLDAVLVDRARPGHAGEDADDRFDVRDVLHL